MRPAFSASAGPAPQALAKSGTAPFSPVPTFADAVVAFMDRILNDLFYDRSYIAGLGELSISCSSTSAAMCVAASHRSKQALWNPRKSNPCLPESTTQESDRGAV